jgi:hypothetical protein
VIELRTANKPSGTRLRARLDEFSLAGANAPILLVSQCWIDIDLRLDAPTEFVVWAPPGKYHAFGVRLSKIEVDGQLHGPMGTEFWRAAFEIALQVFPERPAQVRIDADLGALLSGAELARALDIRVVPGKDPQSFVMPEKGPAHFVLPIPARAPTLTLQAGVDLAAQALPPGTKVTLQERDPCDLPALFAGQHIVGPVIEVHAGERLAGDAEISVPYEPTLLASAGIAPAGIVVLQWDKAAGCYRELRPARLDTRRQRLTIRSRTFSAFFACTPGIEILAPPLQQDAWGRAVGFSSSTTVTVAGRTSDDRAQVALTQPPVAATWAGLGWFDFENLPQGPEETPIVLTASIDGMVPHDCEFVSRRMPPPKRVTTPSRLYGPHLAISRQNIPVVSAVVIQTRFSSDDLFAPIATWQQAFSRHGPYLYRPNEQRDGWRWQALLPDAFFENEAARMTIRALAALTPIPIDPGVPERVRALAAVASFLTANPSALVQQTVLQVLNLSGNPFRAGGLTLSSRVPVLMLEGDQFGAAFVAATLEGVEAADQSTLKDPLRSLHGGLPAYPQPRPEVFAGRLFYVTGSLEGDPKDFQREVVSDGLWCAAVALRRDPRSQQPVIVAIGVLADRDQQPRSAIRLFRRRPDGTWTDEVVLDDRAFLDVDFDFGPGGDVRIVAALAATPVWVLTQLVLVQQVAGQWTASPIAFPKGDSGRISDRGISPRIHVDDQGRNWVVSGDLVGAYEWTIAVEDNGVWNGTLIQRGSSADLTGSQIVSNPEFLVVSGVSLAHWAPAIVPDGSGGLWCAYSNGMLNLAHIDLNSLQVELGEIDVDRETGFYPSLALRASGAPAVVYKDPWGPGISGLLDLDDLQFLSVEDGYVVPGGERFAPLLPPFGNGFVDLAAFGPHVRLDCSNVLNPARLPDLLASILMNLHWHIVFLPAGGWYPSGLVYRTSHPRLAQLVEGLRRRPTMAVFTIDNRDFPDENIGRIDITSFLDPLGTIDSELVGDLDSRTVSSALVSAFAGQNIPLHPGNSAIQVLNPGTAWDLTDSTAFQVGTSSFSQLYQIRKEDDRLSVRIPPVLTVTDRAGPRDSLGRPMPCMILQETWDSQAAPFLNLFTGFSIQLPKDTPGRIVYVSYGNMHVSAYQPAYPASAQQGGVKFTIEVPQIYARNEDPGVDIEATEPSTIELVLAPFVQEGRLRWWVREATVTIGHLNAEVDLFLFGWLQWLWLVPGVNLLLLGFNPIANAYATSAVNDQLNPPDTGTLQGLIAQAMQMWVDARVGETADSPGPFDAAHLRRLYIRTWGRASISGPDQSVLDVVPASGLSFGQVTIGAAPADRNLLLTSDGEIPVFLEEVGVTVGAPEFRIASVPAWPSILPSGGSLVMPVEFVPDIPPGFRNGTLTATFNGGKRIAVALRALALPRPQPVIRIRPPDLLNFGVVVAGQQSQASVAVFNDGDATLDLAAPRIDGDPALIGAFAVVAPTVLSVPPQGSAMLALSFAPPRGGATHFEARLILDSNDPDHPRSQLSVFGVAAAGTLLVLPTAVHFGDTQLDANIPPLPPGLPPTVHRGSTSGVTLYNTGAAGLTILAASFQVTDANGVPSVDYHLWNVDGSAVQQVDLPLAAGAMHTLVIQFLPIAAGLHAARLPIRSDDPTQPLVTVNVTGTGIA